MAVGDKRQILYAALLKYSPEAGSLRERVLDRLVLLALLDSSESQPMRVGAIQRGTRFDPTYRGLRTEWIQETLTRLMRRDLVLRTTLRQRHAYYLSETGQNSTDEATQSASQLFEPVLDRMLRNTESICDRTDAEVVCRTFISECFGRFGQEIAKAVTGEYTKDQLMDLADVHGAFDAAVTEVSITEEAAESLESRCIGFLRSNDPQDEELKFRLTQGYYVAQLLGFQTNSFDPIADDVFRNAIFYLDTNVLIVCLLSDDGAHLLQELVRICNALGIELRVTRATIQEARSVASSRVDDIANILPTLPTEVVQMARDQFLDAFLDARSANPDLSPQDFLDRFNNLPALLNEYGIELDDRMEDEVIAGRDVTRECGILNEAAQRTRGWGKSRAVCLHDICHYILVTQERTQGRKAWFLTRDRTLGRAAVELDGVDGPFCFPLAGFAQSVSPFLETSDVESSLVELFSAVLHGEIGDLSGRSLFDLSELRVISELHTDVLVTPSEQLVPALDYVKRTVLQGRPYRLEEHTKVALGLKTFLTSSGKNKQSALHAALVRKSEIADTERSRRERTEQALQMTQNRMSQLESQCEDLLRNEENESGEVDQLRKQLERAKRRHIGDARREIWLRFVVAFLGSGLSVTIWVLDDAIAGRLAQVLSYQDVAGLDSQWIRLVGAVVLVGGFLPAAQMMQKPWRRGILTSIIVLALLGFDIVGSERVSEIAGYLAVATPVAMIVATFLGWNATSREEE